MEPRIRITGPTYGPCLVISPGPLAWNRTGPDVLVHAGWRSTEGPQRVTKSAWVAGSSKRRLGLPGSVAYTEASESPLPLARPKDKR